MIQGYVIRLVREGKATMVYHGICYGDGVTAESRVEDELSGRKRVNARLKAALEEHGRYAFDWDVTGNFDSVYEAIMDEAARIERDKSWHPDYGFNVEKMDKKRLAKALADLVPGASVESQLDAAMKDFRSNNPEWIAFECDARNENALREMAKKKMCSVNTAFSLCLESGSIPVAVA